MPSFHSYIYIYFMVKYNKFRSFKYLVKEPLKIFYEYYLSIFLN